MKKITEEEYRYDVGGENEHHVEIFREDGVVAQVNVNYPFSREGAKIGDGFRTTTTITNLESFREFLADLMQVIGDG